MIIIYQTSHIAKEVGLHPNTIRFYEQLNYLPPVQRKTNGYRIFTDIHLKQLELIKIALRSNILQAGLREKAIEIIILCADGQYEEALTKTTVYHELIHNEQEKAVEAVALVHNFLSTAPNHVENLSLTRSQTATHLSITIDVLRNWELNGLLQVPRSSNGYRIYTNKTINELKIIRTLRQANYSLMAILRMLNQLRNSSNVDLRHTLDTPRPDEDIVYVTDKLLTSLSDAEADTNKITSYIEEIKAMIQ